MPSAGHAGKERRKVRWARETKQAPRGAGNGTRWKRTKKGPMGTRKPAYDAGLMNEEGPRGAKKANEERSDGRKKKD